LPLRQSCPVLTEPDDLDRGALESLLERRWRLREPRLEYLPVGFGSHHWLATDSAGTERFVSVDDLDLPFQAGPDANGTFVALGRAFGTAAWLRDEAGLDFVVAPLPDDDGVVIHRVDARYAVTVSPLVAGEKSTFGAYESAEERRLMGTVLGRLHAVSEDVPAGLPRREDLALPARRALEEALLELDREWAYGPFAEPTRRALRERVGRLEQRLREYDELVAAVRASAEPWVLTHGEPHRANVIRSPEGGVHLVDWDTTLIAPRERDLRMVLDDDLTGWDEYVAAAGDVSLNQEAVKLYERWWELCDITVFVDEFRRPHRRTEQTLATWEILAANLAAA
jgi:spectinomycin phosphotransferase